MTQKDLAEKLHVSDKAVSRWETGKGLPDTGTLPELAAELDVSVGELLAGERMADDEVRAATDGVILDSLRYTGEMLRKFAGMALLAWGAALLLSPLFLAGGNVFLPVGGGALLFAGALLPVSARKGAADRTFLYGSSVALKAAALALECVTGSVILRFYAGPEDAMGHVYSYSYFSLTPFGYAYFTPLLVGALTAASLGLGLIALRTGSGRRLRNAVFLVDLFAILLSLLPALFSYELTAVNYIVPALFVVSAAMQAAANRQ